MNVLWQKLLLTTIFWLAIEICFNLIGIDEIADYSEFIFQTIVLKEITNNDNRFSTFS